MCWEVLQSLRRLSLVTRAPLLSQAQSGQPCHVLSPARVQVLQRSLPSQSTETTDRKGSGVKGPY